MSPLYSIAILNASPVVGIVKTKLPCYALARNRRYKLAPYKKHLAELANAKVQVQRKLAYLTREEEQVTRAMQKECPHLITDEKMYAPEAYARICVDCGNFD